MTAPLHARDASTDVKYERLAKRLMAYVRKRCQRHELGAPGRVMEGIELQDVAQEAFVRAFAQRHLWAPQRGGLEDFLFYRAKEHLRRRPDHLVKHKERTTTEGLDAALDHVQDSESALKTLERAEARQVILAALDDPLERYLVAAILNGEDLGAQEIAEKFGVDVRDVYRARERMKKRKTFTDLVEKMLKPDGPHD